MLAIHIITVGRNKESWVGEAIAHYTTMLSKYCRTTYSTVNEERYSKASEIKAALQREAKAIKGQLNGGFTIALDIDGQNPDTLEFSKQLVEWKNGGVSHLEFIIGGPYGLDEDLRKNCDYRLSLSPMTMSHQVVRLVLLEQLYRIMNLAAGGSYHK